MALFRRDPTVIPIDPILRAQHSALVASALPNPGTPKLQVANPRTTSATPDQLEALRSVAVSEDIAYANSVVEGMAKLLRFTVEQKIDGRWTEVDSNSELLDLLVSDSGTAEDLLASALGDLFLAGETQLGLFSDHLVAYSPSEVSDTVVRRASLLTDAAPKRLIKVWLPEPENATRSFSPLFSVLPAIRMLRLIDDLTLATVTSRLTGSGILLIPDDTVFLAEDGTTLDTSSQVARMIIQAGAVAIANPSSPSAKVPILITASKETIADWRTLDFGGGADLDALSTLRAEMTARIRRGLSIPEVLIQSDGATHFSLATSLESARQFFVSSAASVLCSALTLSVVRPVLGPDFRLNVSLLGLVSRVRQLADAINLYDRGLLSDASLLETAGFDASDMPTPEELKNRRFLQLAQSQPASLGVAYLDSLGIPIDQSLFPAIGSAPAVTSTTTGQAPPNPRDIVNGGVAA